MLITNPFFGKQEGFGEQYKNIIMYMIFCELKNFKFVYTPFSAVAHNYDNDPRFINDLENFIGLRESLEEYDPHTHQLDDVFVGDVLHYLHNNMGDFEKSQSLKFIKKRFREKNPDLKPSDNFEIAIHLRRPNSHDTLSHSGLFVSNDVYVSILKNLASIYPQKKIIHIHSQGNLCDFEFFFNIKEIKESDTKLQIHLNEELKQTFTSMVYSNILVVAPSALSYTAALLSSNKVFYLKHCNPALPSWSLIYGYSTPRMFHKFKHETTVYFDSEKGEYIIYKDSFGFHPLRIIN